MPSQPVSTRQPPVRTRFPEASSMLPFTRSLDTDKSDPTVWKLHDLVELTENLIEVALEGDADGVAVASEAVKGAAREVAPLLRQGVAAQIAIRLLEILAATRRDDLVALTFATLELYRLAARQLSSVGGSSIKPVLLLNYAGLKLIALSRLVPLDWVAVYDTLGEIVLFSYCIDHAPYPICIGKALADTVTTLLDAIGANDRQRLEQSARRIHIIALRLAGQLDHLHA